jgi:hypothetical protein
VYIATGLDLSRVTGTHLNTLRSLACVYYNNFIHAVYIQSIREQFRLKMVIIHVNADDDTYAYGDMECELDANGKGIEPFIYKDGNRTIECFVSKHVYIEKEDNKLTKVVHTSTSWSDDWDTYTIKDDKVVHLESTEHGMNRRYIYYTDGIASDIEYSRRVFGSAAIGDRAPLISELIMSVVDTQ